MKHPPYPIRMNKAVDRRMLVEVVRRVVSVDEINQYVYYSLGGPYLEDFRLMHEHFPEMRMVSVEENEDTFRRQKFHIPCNRVELRLCPFDTFLKTFDPGNRKSIVWLDYTGLTVNCITEFVSLIGTVLDESIVKLTLRAHSPDYADTDKSAEFLKDFADFLTPDITTVPSQSEELAFLIQSMARVAIQRTLPIATGRVFQPVTSFYYKDGVGIFTLTGVICNRHAVEKLRARCRRVPFANLDWNAPRLIDVPFLSTKERLRLQRHLPRRNASGERLARILGYWIDEDQASSVQKMKQYSDFQQFYPFLVRAIP